MANIIEHSHRSGSERSSNNDQHDEYHDNSYSSTLPYISILGVPISAITMAVAVQTIMNWTERRQVKYVCVRDVHGLMLAVRDPRLMNIHRNAGMVTPDGMPLVWLSKLRSKLKIGRVCGSDLLDAMCRAGEAKNLRHFFYGGKPGVPEAMAHKLKAKYSGLCVVGFYSPPFRRLTDEEDNIVVDYINQSGAQIVWVGLSTPKQEFWMHDHVGRIQGATLLGVGAAFDFHSGSIARAPKWLQNLGLEWFHRLLSEPRRLWSRYFIVIPQFLVEVVREQVTLYLTGKV